MHGARLPVAALIAGVLACVAVIAVELKQSRTGHHYQLSYRAPAPETNRAVHSPPLRPLHRSHLNGYWRATGYVTTGDGTIYPLHTELDRRWLFYRACLAHRCHLSFARSSSSGALMAVVRQKSRTIWTAAFPRYGEIVCGRPGHSRALPLSSRWQFHLTPALPRLEATEMVTPPRSCSSSPFEIEWLATPAAAPSAPPAPSPAGAPAQAS